MPPIIQVQSITKMELNYHERSDREQSLTKTKQNNVTDHIGVVYEESETKLS